MHGKTFVALIFNVFPSFFVWFSKTIFLAVKLCQFSDYLSTSPLLTSLINEVHKIYIGQHSASTVRNKHMSGIDEGKDKVNNGSWLNHILLHFTLLPLVVTLLLFLHQSFQFGSYIFCIKMKFLKSFYPVLSTLIVQKKFKITLDHVIWLVLGAHMQKDALKNQFITWITDLIPTIHCGIFQRVHFL